MEETQPSFCLIPEYQGKGPCLCTHPGPEVNKPFCLTFTQQGLELLLLFFGSDVSPA